MNPWLCRYESEVDCSGKVRLSSYDSKCARREVVGQECPTYVLVIQESVKALSEAPDKSVGVETIRELWASVLRVDTLSGSSNFFELGGDSLAAMNLVSEISRRWGRTVELGVLFENPQLDAFVAAVNGVSRNAALV